ncbi:MAG: hypothetical protein MZV49_10130 [Rhodopseudomonas palustris]|nr:hypothetical protein [Rhodopseudomonas palustris]
MPRPARRPALAQHCQTHRPVGAIADHAQALPIPFCRYSSASCSAAIVGAFAVRKSCTTDTVISDISRASLLNYFSNKLADLGAQDDAGSEIINV